MFQVVPILQPVMMIPALHELLRAKILDRFDSLSHIAHISCPVLMIHGLGDREIPSLHSRMLFTAAASAHGVAETPAPERAHIVHTVRRAATAPAAARAAAAAVVASKGPVETAGVRDGVAKAQMGVVEDAATLQLAKLFAACEEDAGDRWALEGKRWISTQGAARGDGAQPAGPAKVMLVEADSCSPQQRAVTRPHVRVH
ncbi:hypothetical protein DFJ73DRAFT_356840 [Zopfochytrium polystomum]|nr:hypothetical protein DFJ73DRAFT_356840 [Zopfochytrium polystomum]